MAVSAAAVAGQSFVEKVQQLIDRVEYRRVESRRQLEDIFCLRYEAYFKEGAIEPNSSERLEDKFDEGANVQNFGLYMDGQLISALRIHILHGDQRRSPAAATFPELLFPELDKGKIIIDPNRFVAGYRRARSLPELPYATLRLAIMAADYFDAEMITATVRPEHQAFYLRILRCHPLCEPRAYPNLSKLFGLMAADFKRDRAGVVRRFPFFDSTLAERQMLFGAYPPIGSHATTFQETHHRVQLLPVRAPTPAA
ncbi:MAG: hypothetical protein NVSMB26_23200 [Beijerinckiaceae bacterium]